jgi:hypothetical protein
MARPEVTGQNPLAFTRAEFCVAHRMSKSAYYELLKQGLAPDELRLSSKKIIITAESAARWRKRRTQATARKLRGPRRRRAPELGAAGAR